MKLSDYGVSICIYSKKLHCKSEWSTILATCGRVPNSAEVAIYLMMHGEYLEGSGQIVKGHVLKRSGFLNMYIRNTLKNYENA